MINHYVEHYNCKVIVIAHDAKLSEEIIDQKEKLFGQVIRVYPRIDLAYPAFVSAMSGPGEQKILLEFQSILVNIFAESGVGSLRILRHVMEDVLRLMRCLTEAHRANSAMVRDLVSCVAALNFECRANRLRPEDLFDRRKQEIAYMMIRKGGDDNDQPRIVTSIKRYATTRLDSVIIPDNTLKEMLFDGIYRSDVIENAINASSFFVKPADLPAWRTFIDFQDQADEIVEEALIKFRDEFENRAIVEPGENATRVFLFG